MPQLINRVPRGLLGLLDSKAAGQNPALLLDEVQGGVELTDLYALNTRGTVSQASSLTAAGVTAGIFTSLIVPDGEIWLVKAVTAHLSAPPLGAAATLQIKAGFITSESARFNGLTELSPSIATGGDVCVAWSGSIWLMPGDQPQVYATVFTGGPHGVRLNVLRSRFVL